MKCSRCNVEMEREDYGDVRMKEIYDRPEAWYVCPECGREVRWIKGRGTKVYFDPSENGRDLIEPSFG